ncbi:hypothetical protein BDY19DRAFT_946534 [Irpex rosettiformis]|uniref:Uncharacterized protein n=1 Tax=Irpex rosettiformis TaxID=378272 RepID=A0ACB8U3M6_9APHY|nr:hypothetical protein BDY19DRAFT_946534 [Irpex rosettiformis]
MSNMIQCPHCPKSFQKSTELTTHMVASRHGWICPKLFCEAGPWRVESKLQRHLQKAHHVGSQAWQMITRCTHPPMNTCLLCGEAVSKMAKHMKKDHEVCVICQASCPDQNAHSKHYRKSHPSHFCEGCERPFVLKNISQKIANVGYYRDLPPQVVSTGLGLSAMGVPDLDAVVSGLGELKSAKSSVKSSSQSKEEMKTKVKLPNSGLNVVDILVDYCANKLRDIDEIDRKSSASEDAIPPSQEIPKQYETTKPCTSPKLSEAINVVSLDERLPGSFEEAKTTHPEPETDGVDPHAHCTPKYTPSASNTATLSPTMSNTESDDWEVMSESSQVSDIASLVDREDFSDVDDVPVIRPAEDNAPTISVISPIADDVESLSPLTSTTHLPSPESDRAPSASEEKVFHIDENVVGNETAPKPPRFSCKLCSDDPKQPTTTMCGHLFCHECIIRELSKNLRCPVCQTVMLVRLHVD